ncbi:MULTISPECIES: spore germination protein [Neobacillus]|uniref:Spore germination protein n=1 Tax=Neobacillus rhizophilus TaxID=2833579 RepID=A0A942YWE2_9BACI|nr:MULTISPECIES: spore germination protein [Neobacillus]MBS4213945.1 spore germination protein [Neobacillus rhizophilus]MBU8917650.1 spore germination protein [Bacillus sp. FJAT-29953]
MSSSINIGRFKVQALSNNANINFEGTTQNSHTSNNTIIGGNFSFGDGSSSTFTNINNGTITVSNENSGQDS